MTGSFLLIIIIGLLGMLVQRRLKNKFKKYSQLHLQNGMTGGQPGAPAWASSSAPSSASRSAAAAGSMLASKASEASGASAPLAPRPGHRPPTTTWVDMGEACSPGNLAAASAPGRSGGVAGAGAAPSKKKKIKRKFKKLATRHSPLTTRHSEC